MPDKKGEIVIYKSKKDQLAVEVRLEKDTVWLSQKQMAVLFNKDVRTINEHIKNLFNEGELAKNSSVIRKFRITASDGKEYLTNFYNLDVIISVGYRVKSKEGTKFRIWATRVLKDHLVKGFTLNRRRLEQDQKEFERAMKLIKGVMRKKALSEDEKTGLLKVITDYADSWIMLQQFDKKELAIPKRTRKVRFVLDYDYAIEAIQELKIKLLKKKEAAAIFGQERGKSMDAILGNLNQSIRGKALYPGIEAKAAHLLYFIIKDHPFVDGNKRIASFLFIVFLARNQYLYDKHGDKKFNDNALVALALLIAESDPKEKDIMIKLVINLVFG